ncbi:MAG: protease modulator HflC [Saccharofermentanales bacterium]
MKKKNIVILGIIAFLLIAFAMCTFQLQESESAVVMRFGRIVSVYVKTDAQAQNVIAGLERENVRLTGIKVHSGTGLQFKLPLIDTVKKYNNRLLTYDTAARQVITSDKKKLIFDNNAQWRIENPALFEVTMGRMEEAEKRLDDILYSMMNEKVGKMEAVVLISDKDEVEKMQNELAIQISDNMSAYGINVFDIRVKRTELPVENYESVYNRMITERQRIAAQYRSEGDELAMEVRSDTDKQIMIILSDARKTAEITKGEGDAEAARIYNEAYGTDEEFYKFYNTLEVYKLTIKDNTKLVIPSDSPFAAYLFGSE